MTNENERTNEASGERRNEQSRRLRHGSVRTTNPQQLWTDKEQFWPPPPLQQIDRPSDRASIELPSSEDREREARSLCLSGTNQLEKIGCGRVTIEVGRDRSLRKMRGGGRRKHFLSSIILKKSFHSVCCWRRPSFVPIVMAVASGMKAATQTVRQQRRKPEADRGDRVVVLKHGCQAASLFPASSSSSAGRRRTKCNQHTTKGS